MLKGPRGPILDGPEKFGRKKIKCNEAAKSAQQHLQIENSQKNQKPSKKQFVCFILGGYGVLTASKSGSNVKREGR